MSAGRIAYELDKALGVNVAHEADARAVPLELACALRLQRTRVFEFRASPESAGRRLDRLVQGQHLRLVLRHARCVLLVERLPDERVRRHDYAGFGPVLAGEPRASVVDDLAVLVIVDCLPKIINATVPVLGE